MAVQYANNVATALASGISDSDLSMTVDDASDFPTVGSGDYCYVTLDSGTGNIEIVKVTTRSGNDLTIERAQDNTLALAFIAGTAVELRITTILLTEVLGTVADGSVTAVKLATDAVETLKIKNLNVTAAKLAADAVETAKIKDLNVTVAKLANDAVETAKIKDLNVTTDKLANSAVTNAKVAASIITGFTEITSLEDDDLFLVSDDSDTNALKKVKKSNLGFATEDININAQSGTSYTFVIGDANSLVTGSNGSATAFTVPTNASVAFPTGTTIAISQLGAGQITIGGAGITFRQANGLKLKNQYSVASIVKIATDTWLVMGDLES